LANGPANTGVFDVLKGREVPNLVPFLREWRCAALSYGVDVVVHPAHLVFESAEPIRELAGLCFWCRGHAGRTPPDPGAGALAVGPLRVVDRQRLVLAAVARIRVDGPCLRVLIAGRFG